ncbi:hypothetical protein [Demequina sp. NBRC 110052]|uniref:hypothetical protein n=1 Tax=Demequina sp. NBRC 110052 TaxID=1570341 RepID=UPI000A0294B6|nr:hypothetical protein [Demequina sp. NBRC 110052]
MKLAVPARIVASAVLALALTGCSFAADITTSDPYAASDGIQVDLDGVKAENLLVISSAEGEPAALIGSFINTSSEDATLTVTLGSDQTAFEVAAGEVVALGTGEGQTEVVGTSPAAPGLIAQITIDAPRTGAQSVDVPVMDGTLEEYAPILDSLG